jgi:hypothetical protein
LILASAEQQLNEFCQYLIENAARLGQEMDNRTIWYVFGYCCEQKNEKLAYFVAPLFDKSLKGVKGLEVYDDYPQIKRTLELLIGATPTTEEQDIIARVEEEELRPYFIHLVESFNDNNPKLPLEFWTDLLVADIPVNNIREFVRLSVKRRDNEVDNLGALYELFDWIDPLKKELYASYMRRSKIEEIDSLIKIIRNDLDPSIRIINNDRYISELLFANLPDELLDHYSQSIMKRMIGHYYDFKTYYHDRYIDNFNGILMNIRVLGPTWTIESGLRYAYFVLSPEEFLNLQKKVKIPHEDTQKLQRREIINIIAFNAKLTDLPAGRNWSGYWQRKFKTNRVSCSSSG